MAEGDESIGLRHPATPGERVNAIAHFHRAEMGRMSDWRKRIDMTTNWAITVVAGMLSVSLSTPSSHHGVLLFAMVIVFLLLWIEARRYRFFDVYRARVRQFERHYFAHILEPRDKDEAWTVVMAASLRAPHFLISHRAALSRRLSRNYIWVFIILLAAWILKIASPRIQGGATLSETVGSVPELVRNAALGPVPGWIVLVAVVLFYAGLVAAIMAGRTRRGEFLHGDVHM